MSKSPVVSSTRVIVDGVRYVVDKGAYSGYRIYPDRKDLPPGYSADCYPIAAASDLYAKVFAYYVWMGGFR